MFCIPITTQNALSLSRNMADIHKMITITITTLSSSFGIWIAKSLHYYNSDKVTTNCGHARYLQNLAMLLQRCLVAYAAGARKKRIAITCRPHRLLTEAVAQCDVVHADHSTANLHRRLSCAITALSHRQYHLLQMLL